MKKIHYYSKLFTSLLSIEAHAKVPVENLPPADAAEAPEGDAPITDSAGDAVIISGADDAAREQEEKALKSLSEDAAARAEREKDTATPFAMKSWP